MHYDDTKGDVLNRVLVEQLMARLSEEDKDFVQWWIWHDKNFDEIGLLFGLKHRGRVLTDSAMRYHRNRILKNFRDMLEEGL